MNPVRGIFIVVAALWFVQPASAQDNQDKRSYVSPFVEDSKLQDKVNPQVAEFYKTYCKLFEALSKAATRQSADANTLITEARSSFKKISEAFSDLSKQTALPLKVAPTSEVKIQLIANRISIPKTYGDVLMIISQAADRAESMLGEVKFDGTPADRAQRERLKYVIVHTGAIVATATDVTASSS